jgi:hypothetical protein
MKKIIYLLSITALIIFNSCSNSDSTSSDKIVGNWKLIGEVDDTVFYPTDNEPCDDDFIKFNGNGTTKETDKNCGSMTFYAYGKWKKSTTPDTYTLTDEANVSYDNVVIFSDNDTVITAYNPDDMSYGLVYKKQ